MTHLNHTGALVEIIDYSGEGPCLVPRAVKVNGVFVGLIAVNGLDIDLPLAGSPDSALTVTLKLMPDRVVMRHAEPGEFD